MVLLRKDKDKTGEPVLWLCYPIPRFIVKGYDTEKGGVGKV